MCMQIDPGYGNSWQHAGISAGGEGEAIRPCQQGSLQAVQTGRALHSTLQRDNIYSEIT